MDFYTITTIKSGDLDHKTHSVVQTLDEARELVGVNMSDMHECFFSHLVIEGYTFGIPIHSNFEEWYVWDKALDKWKWVRIDKPSEIRVENR